MTAGLFSGKGRALLQKELGCLVLTPAGLDLIRWIEIQQAKMQGPARRKGWLGSDGGLAAALPCSGSGGSAGQLGTPAVS